MSALSVGVLGSDESYQTLRFERLRFADFAQPDWVTPADRYPLDLHDVFSFTVAALASADVTVASLAVDGYAPPCE